MVGLIRCKCFVILFIYVYNCFRLGDRMKSKRFNNRGFTLVELLVVIVILIAIVSLAIPSITSSMERSKDKINAGKLEVLGSAGELYLSSKNRSKLNDYYKGKCYVTLTELKTDGYISDEEMKDANGDRFKEQVYWDKINNVYTTSDNSGVDKCITP